jgi:uncharacterized protein (TIGR03437 family)
MIQRLAPLCAAVAAFAGLAAAQSWDTSGNSKLNGTFYFRQVVYAIGDSYGDLSQATAIYGTIAFDGNGNYSMTATGYDSSQGPLSGTLSGTYSIAASGYGFISNPLFGSNQVYIYGLVSQQGIFVGSSTESGYNDLFIAAPISSSTNLATLKGAYTIAGIDLSSGSPSYTSSMMFQVNPDGAGNLGNITVTGYLGGGGSSQYNQSLSRVPYSFSNGAYNFSIPNSTSANFLSGQKFMYISPDGNFIFGGSPTSWDFFVGVRTGTSTPTFGGLYYQTGIDEPVDSGGTGYLDTYYGSLNGSNGSLIGHQRVSDALSGTSYDYTYGDTYSLQSGGAYSDSYARYVIGANGTVRIGSGIGPYLGLNVALAAPTLSGSGVFLNPEGVVNAGSWAPFTAAIAPGEFIALNGTGLAPSGLPVANSIPFPTSIGPVQVLINGVAAPLYYATPNVIVAIVPYGTTNSIATVQVVNNNVASNTVTTFVGLTAPGVFTQNQNGLGYGSIQHSDYSLVTAAHPAVPGETLLVYLTGLGAVSTAVSDGAAAPSDSLDSTVSTITATIGGASATVSYAGLTPGAVALYQVNVVVPSTATAGDNQLAITGPDAYSVEATIPVSTTSTSSSNAKLRPVGPRFERQDVGQRRLNVK